MTNINGFYPIFDLEDLEDKTQNIDLATTSSGNTNFLGVLEVNGVPVGGGGGITNPLTADLNFNNFDATNVTDLNTKPVAQIVRNIVGAVSSSNLPIYSDTTGLELKDSGISVNNISSNSNSIIGLQSLTQNTYPRGASNSWTNLNPANSQGLVTYAPEIATMVGGSTAGGISYSLDNGTTWTSVALGGVFYVVGWSGTLFVALGVGTPSAYTSPNGVTWSLQAAPPFAVLTDTMRSFWSSLANLFICGTNNGVSGIITSPNGVTWTAQTSTRSPFRLANNSSIIVGASATGFVYSTNGTTWTNTADSFNCRTVVYSSERKEFIAGSASTTTSYRSTDGITWTAFASILPSAIQELNWTPSISKYWFAARNPSTLLYSLYYSSDGVTPFLSNPNMIGATNSGALYYSSFFSVPLNRFYIFSNNLPQVHYADSSTITSLVGPLIAITPTGSWYCSTSYLPLFGAGVARLVPPTVSTVGTSLRNFTYAAGVLTYTGSVTRDFRISYNISLLLGASLANMTFFNSINGSLVIAATQSRQFYQSQPSNNATRVCFVLTDNISLANGNTVQLAAICATASATTSLDFISCNISSTLS